jgi:hypothetical protein
MFARAAETSAESEEVWRSSGAHTRPATFELCIGITGKNPALLSGACRPRTKSIDSICSAIAAVDVSERSLGQSLVVVFENAQVVFYVPC